MQGSNLVGTADLPLHRRAQLGVLAHIRHVYTNYEQLLRLGEWKDARAAVEHQCLDKLVQWRGDDEDDADAMSDILREVIVIPDDENDYDSNPTLENTIQDGEREASVEVIATRAAANAVRTQQINLQNHSDEDSDTGPDSDDADVGAYRFQTVHDQRYSNKVAAHRHKAWAAARDRRRKGPQNIEYISSCPLSRSNEATALQSKSHQASHDRCMEGSAGSPGRAQRSEPNRMPFISDIRGVQSTHGENVPNTVIDLTTGSPYQSRHPYAQVSFVAGVKVHRNKSFIATYYIL